MDITDDKPTLTGPSRVGSIFHRDSTCNTGGVEVDNVQNNLYCTRDRGTPLNSNGHQTWLITVQQSTSTSLKIPSTIVIRTTLFRISLTYELTNRCQCASCGLYQTVPWTFLAYCNEWPAWDGVLVVVLGKIKWRWDSNRVFSNSHRIEQFSVWLENNQHREQGTNFTFM